MCPGSSILIPTLISYQLSNRSRTHNGIVLTVALHYNLTTLFSFLMKAFGKKSVKTFYVDKLKCQDLSYFVLSFRTRLTTIAQVIYLFTITLKVNVS